MFCLYKNILEASHPIGSGVIGGRLCCYWERAGGSALEASESEGREIRGLEGLLITPGRYAECARCTVRLVGSGLPEGFLTGMNQTREEFFPGHLIICLLREVHHGTWSRGTCCRRGIKHSNPVTRKERLVLVGVRLIDRCKRFSRGADPKRS